MRYEDYIKSQLKEKNVKLSTAADVLGYTCEQGLRNKFPRQTLHLKDILTFSDMLDEKVQIVDKNGGMKYQFDIKDYLDVETIEKLKAYHFASRPSFSEWYDALSQDERNAIIAPINKKKGHNKDWVNQKLTSGCSTSIPSANFKEEVFIYGENCQSAKEHLNIINSGTTPEDEFRNVLNTSNEYDVYIMYSHPIIIE